MKKRVNITLDDKMLAVCDILSKRKGMDRSNYINFLINCALESERDVRSIIADECISDMTDLLK